MKKIIFTFICLSQILFSQLDTLWTKTYGGNSYDYATCAIEINGGGFIIVGKSWNIDSSLWNLIIIRTTISGDEIWSQLYESNVSNIGNSVVQTNDGGFIITGFIQDNETYPYVFLLKIDINGFEEWFHTFSDLGNSKGFSLEQTLNGEFIVVGESWSEESGTKSFILKTDSNGNEEWFYKYGITEGSYYGRAIKETFDGGYIQTGYYRASDSDDFNIFLIKTDSSGIEEWDQEYGGDGFDRGYDVQITSDGGVVIGGATNSFGGNWDYYLIKTDSLGIEEWSSTFGGQNSDMSFSVHESYDGGFVLGGTTNSFGNGNSDFWVVKTDMNGVEEWSISFGGINDDYCNVILETSDGRYLSAGVTSSYGNGEEDMWLVYFGHSNGCTIQYAINFDPLSTIDDGSCYYLSDIDQHFQQNWEGIPQNPMGIYVNSAIFNEINLRIGDEVGVFDGIECVGMIQLTEEIISPIQLFLSEDIPDTPEIDGFISGGNISFKFWDASEQLEVTNANSTLLNGNNVFTPLGFSEIELQVNSILGCTEINSVNYNPVATINDGSCINYNFGCTDPDACNFDSEANTDFYNCLYEDCNGECGGDAIINECGCVGGTTGNEPQYCFGCTDPYAINYDQIATFDDNTCDYPNIGDISMDGLINVTDIVFLVGVVLEGNDYIEYMDFNQDTYLNIIDIVILVDIILNPEYFGCMDSSAINYSPDAIYESSCEYGIVIDFDGNTYNTAIIGNQEWMSENLRVSHYKNGEEIPTGFSAEEWSQLENDWLGAFAIYNDEPEHTEIYGYLYNWFAVNDDRGVCPEDWHVPTDDEWTELSDYLSGYLTAGGMMKGIGTIEEGDGLWNEPNLGANNESGFTALPGGKRHNLGHFNLINSNGIFWSSTANLNSEFYSWSRTLHYTHSRIERDSYYWVNGFSIRCIKDSQ
jgi:uncharacterized protein (TIGR02145 family)